MNAVPTISQPQADGASGVEFAYTVEQGVNRLQIPLPTAAARFAPSLALVYRTDMREQGSFGLGWALNMPQIVARGDTITFRDESLFADATTLRTENDERYTVVRYRPHIEQDFTRVERWTRTATESVHWRTTSRAGVMNTHGFTSGARGGADTWLLEEARDGHGNLIAYTYDGEKRLQRVFYGNAAPDVPGGWMFELRLSYDDALCTRATLIHRFEELGELPLTVRTMDFGYDVQPGVSLLTTITVTGYDSDEGESLPPLTFTYMPLTLDGTVRITEAVRAEAWDGNQPRSQWGGVWYTQRHDGDGGFGMLTTADAPIAPTTDGVIANIGGAPVHVQVFHDRVCYTAADGDLVRMPVALDHADAFDPSRVRLADFTGDGRADLVYFGRHRARLWLNLRGVAWSAPWEVPAFPRTATYTDVLDLHGDGRACIVWQLPGEVHLRYVQPVNAPLHWMVQARVNDNLKVQFGAMQNPTAPEQWVVESALVSIAEQQQTERYTYAQNFIERKLTGNEAVDDAALIREWYDDDGNTLRQETYTAPDDTKIDNRANRPRRIVSYQYNTQEMFGSRYTYVSDRIEHTYSATGSERHTKHTLTLAVDAYGNVTREAVVYYPSRNPAFPEQSELYATLTERRFVYRDSERYHAGQLVEERIFELTSPDFASYEPPLRAETLDEFGKRLLTHRQMNYTNNLHAETLERVFTPWQVREIYEERVSDAMLRAAGYIWRGGAWWRSMGRTEYAPELFDRPVRTIDAFGNASEILYDQYALLPLETRDAIGNIVRAVQDYRTLQPTEITDINDNVSVTEYDALGRVTAIARLDIHGAPVDLRAYEYGSGWLYEEHEGRETWIFYDGLGRAVGHKVKANDTEWATSEWTTWGRDGHWVYPPYMSSNLDTGQEARAADQHRHDIFGRNVETRNLDGTITRTVYGPWHREDWDASDTVLESAWFSERITLDEDDPAYRAAEDSAEFANTPTITHLDALGRPFLSIEDNGRRGKLSTQRSFDIDGRLVEEYDAAGQRVLEQMWDAVGRLVYRWTAAGGARWYLHTADDHPAFQWDSRGHRFRYEYDTIRRLTHRYVRTRAEILVEERAYGEDEPEAADRNLRGQVFRHADGAGILTYSRYDVEGRPLESIRRFTENPRRTSDWSINPSLAAESFATARAYDAFGNLVEHTLPDGTVLFYRYNQRGLLQSVRYHGPGSDIMVLVIRDIDYDARGQRLGVLYPNGAETRYIYQGVQVARKVTTRGTVLLQDSTYTYDANGNLTNIEDMADQSLLFAGRVTEAGGRFGYDALGRLVFARGREYAGPEAAWQRDEVDYPAVTLPYNGPLRPYTERYNYDFAGRLQKVAHSASGGGWVRYYDLDPLTGHLLANSLPGDDPLGPYSADTYACDPHGNTTEMPHLAELRWSYDDRLQLVDLEGGGVVYFSYNASGQRLRKRVQRRVGDYDELITLDGYERWQRRAGENRERLRLVFWHEGWQLAMLTVDGLFFILDNMILDETGAVAGYTEFYPLGGAAFHSGQLHRTQDPETGLIGTYAPWLGRDIMGGTL